MKFTPESLIEIYMNGSFTEEAQEEFDALMKSDAAFAERVTHSMAERLGPLPAGLEDKIAGRLDSKIESLWSAHRPSPWSGLLKLSLKAVLLLAAVGGVVEAVRHFEVQNPPAAGPQAGMSSGVETSRSVGLTQAAGSPLVKNSVLEKRKKIVSDPSSRLEKQNQTLSLSFKASPAEGRAALPALAAQGETQAKPAVDLRKDNASGSAGPSFSEEGDALRVSVEMEKTGKVIINVLDSNGLLVRGLYQGVWNSGLHLLDWDGKDEAGNQVQPGNYTVAVNADGKTMSGTLTIRPDR